MKSFLKDGLLHHRDSRNSVDPQLCAYEVLFTLFHTASVVEKLRMYTIICPQHYHLGYHVGQKQHILGGDIPVGWVEVILGLTKH